MRWKNFLKENGVMKMKQRVQVCDALIVFRHKFLHSFRP
jgi:hypothetical protein